MRAPGRISGEFYNCTINQCTTLREEFMFDIPKPNSDPDIIAKLLIQNGAGGRCYIISDL
jgi:hypothetical protein